MVMAGEIVAKVKADNTDFERGIQDSIRHMRSLEQQTRAMGAGVARGSGEASRGLSGMQKTAIGATVAFGALAVAGAKVGGAIFRLGQQVYQAGLQMNATLETTTLQFETLMGSAEAAEKHVASIFEFAKLTPFETQPIIVASRMLQTFGGVALNTEEMLQLVGDASAAATVDISELGFWVGRTYSMIKSGKPFGEAAMRLQEMAVLSPQARNEMERLQKAGADAADVFAVFTEDLGRFEGAMIKQAQTWQGLTSTLQDTKELTAGEIFKPIFEELKRGLKIMVDFTESRAFEYWVQKATRLSESLAGVIGRLLDKFESGIDLRDLGTIGVLLDTMISSAQSAEVSVSGIATAFKEMGLLGSAALGAILPLISPWTAMLAHLVVSSDEFRSGLIALGGTMIELAAAAAPALLEIIGALLDVVEDLMPSMVRLADAVGEVLVPVIALAGEIAVALVPAIELMGSVVATAAEFLADHKEIVQITIGLALATWALKAAAAMVTFGRAIKGATIALLAHNVALGATSKLGITAAGANSIGGLSQLFRGAGTGAAMASTKIGLLGGTIGKSSGGLAALGVSAGAATAALGVLGGAIGLGVWRMGQLADEEAEAKRHMESYLAVLQEVNDETERAVGLQEALSNALAETTPGNQPYFEDLAGSSQDVLTQIGLIDSLRRSITDLDAGPWERASGRMADSMDEIADAVARVRQGGASDLADAADFLPTDMVLDIQRFADQIPEFDFGGTMELTEVLDLIDIINGAIEDGSNEWGNYTDAVEEAAAEEQRLLDAALMRRASMPYNPEQIDVRTAFGGVQDELQGIADAGTAFATLDVAQAATAMSNALMSFADTAKIAAANTNEGVADLEGFVAGMYEGVVAAGQYKEQLAALGSEGYGDIVEELSKLDPQQAQALLAEMVTVGPDGQATIQEDARALIDAFQTTIEARSEVAGQEAAAKFMTELEVMKIGARDLGTASIDEIISGLGQNAGKLGPELQEMTDKEFRWALGAISQIAATAGSDAGPVAMQAMMDNLQIPAGPEQEAFKAMIEEMIAAGIIDAEAVVDPMQIEALLSEENPLTNQYAEDKAMIEEDPIQAQAEFAQGELANMERVLRQNAANWAPVGISARITSVDTSALGGIDLHINGGIHEAFGGIRRYAAGKVESHNAEISPPTWRLWAEPETGGEAYIPLALSKRARSLAILGDVAKMFGVDLIKTYADGAVNVASAIGAFDKDRQGRAFLRLQLKGAGVSDDDLNAYVDSFMQAIDVIGSDAAAAAFRRVGKDMDAFNDLVGIMSNQMVESSEKMKNAFDFGAVDSDDYIAFLRERLAATEAFSSEWMQIVGEIGRASEQFIAQNFEVVGSALAQFTAPREARVAVLDARQELQDAIRDRNIFATDPTRSRADRARDQLAVDQALVGLAQGFMQRAQLMVNSGQLAPEDVHKFVMERLRESTKGMGVSQSVKEIGQLVTAEYKDTFGREGSATVDIGSQKIDIENINITGMDVTQELVEQIIWEALEQAGVQR